MHHIYPKEYLKKQGMQRGMYNQIANFVIAQSEINIAIGDKSPQKYIAEIIEQCNGSMKKYGGITDMQDLMNNFKTHCIPEALLNGDIPKYEDFLEERRKLMAIKIKTWYKML